MLKPNNTKFLNSILDKAYELEVRHRDTAMSFAISRAVERQLTSLGFYPTARRIAIEMDYDKARKRKLLPKVGKGAFIGGPKKAPEIGVHCG